MKCALIYIGPLFTKLFDTDFHRDLTLNASYGGYKGFVEYPVNMAHLDCLTKQPGYA